MNTETPTLTEAPPSSLWAGSLLAVSLVVLQCFLPLSNLDCAALISVYAFALAMPILAYKILIDIMRARKYNTRVQSWHHSATTIRTPYPELFLFVAGVLFALVGTAAAFWHINWIAAVIFSVCTLVVFVAYLFHTRV